MDIIIVLIVCVFVIAIASLFFLNNDAKSLDINRDNKVDFNDVKAAVDNAVEKVKVAADVNQDGAIDSKDALVAVETVKKAVKKTINKTTDKASTAVSKKPLKAKPAANMANSNNKVARKSNKQS